ncbi:hypothetical protein [Actomonas aquatica]|uniref:Uncharacterized protein n=1 Tax=Actomonas aquatica TaxID=2866162 RepID=A0ABZ1CDI7_9BACT|nr:hypothetical protein [Opitutus sp. WL0086]WRQ89477.1 hypothetical protein K1X11_008650 [Opitutus sp. WL0086]
MSAIQSGDGAVIATEMARLDGFLEAGRGQLPPRLVHFLQNRSYAKALMFLEGEGDIPAGICGGKH